MGPGSARPHAPLAAIASASRLLEHARALAVFLLGDLSAREPLVQDRSGLVAPFGWFRRAGGGSAHDEDHDRDDEGPREDHPDDPPSTVVPAVGHHVLLSSPSCCPSRCPSSRRGFPSRCPSCRRPSPSGENPCSHSSSRRRPSSAPSARAWPDTLRSAE